MTAKQSVLVEARRRLLDTKLWGHTPEQAIRTGQWDEGSLVQGFVAEIENERLRNLPEGDE